MTLPVLTIVGRPNVGKSTLFNRLTRTRNAIVAGMPGVTRDRQYGEGRLGDYRFIVVDTGGIVECHDPNIASMTEKQAEQAVAESDVILFMVDANIGLVSSDIEIANKLRHYSNKRIVLVVNKVDREQADIASSDFFQLGFEHIAAISAESGRGVEAMLADIMPDYGMTDELQSITETRTRVAVIGRPNVGKSTLINRLLGEERVIVLDQPGTTRDAISIPYDRDLEHYTLIDTAGIRRQSKMDKGVETFSVVKSIQAIQQAHVVIMMINAREGVTDQDLRLLGLVIESGNAFAIALNKWDHMDQYDREQVKAAVDRKLAFVHYARRYFISAKHGTGVGQLYDAIRESKQALEQLFSTPNLTRVLMDAVKAYQPPLVHGRRVKLRYAHIGSRHPLCIVLHGKQVNELPSSYKQYLSNRFREIFRLTGVPLLMKYVNDENPYIND